VSSDATPSPSPTSFLLESGAAAAGALPWPRRHRRTHAAEPPCARSRRAAARPRYAWPPDRGAPCLHRRPATAGPVRRRAAARETAGPPCAGPRAAAARPRAGRPPWPRASAAAPVAGPAGGEHPSPPPRQPWLGARARAGELGWAPSH
jgi:hypothetical protein